MSRFSPENQANDPLLATQPTPERITTVVNNLPQPNPATAPPPHSTTIIIKIAIFLLFLYLAFGVCVYFFLPNHFSGTETVRIVDAFYFSIVSMCTVGYGDITPLTRLTKLFAVCYVIIGICLLDILLTDVVDYILCFLSRAILTVIKPGSTARNRVNVTGIEPGSTVIDTANSTGIGPDSRNTMIFTEIGSGTTANLTRIEPGLVKINSMNFSVRDWIVDVAKGKAKIWWKLCLALSVVVLCIITGVLVLNNVEGLDFVDSVYLSVMSVTTVGYGDKTFKTFGGRLFAAFWIFASTLAVARAFCYFAEARSDLRYRDAVKLALNRDFTVEDLINADTHQHGFISKSEFIVLKLKEIGKISEEDIKPVLTKFEELDTNNLGKITLTQLSS